MIGHGWDLFFYTWQPFNVNSWPTYILGNSFICLNGFFCCFTAVVLLTSTAACSEHLIAQLKILRCVINTLPHCDSPQNFQRTLKECVNHQQVLYDYFNLLQHVLNYPLLLLYLNFGMILCTATYEMTDAQSTLAIKIAYITVILPELLLPLGGCMYSQQICLESEGIKDSIYNLNWFNFNPKQRKDLIFIMTRCQRPIMLNAGGLSKCSLKSYQELLVAAYSYLNMLQAIKK